MTQTFNCIACGAPNEPDAGASRMACTFCGTNLTIPENLRIKSQPKVETNFRKAETSRPVEIEASEMLRKAQPVAIRAWNLFAMWTWLKWLIPTCFVISIILCIVLVIILFSFGL
jgi:hypothetical protein